LNGRQAEDRLVEHMKGLGPLDSKRVVRPHDLCDRFREGLECRFSTGGRVQHVAATASRNHPQQADQGPFYVQFSRQGFLQDGQQCRLPNVRQILGRNPAETATHPATDNAAIAIGNPPDSRADFRLASLQQSPDFLVIEAGTLDHSRTLPLREIATT
jgi:hypothetical protein